MERLRRVVPHENYLSNSGLLQGNRLCLKMSRNLGMVHSLDKSTVMSPVVPLSWTRASGQ